MIGLSGDDLIVESTLDTHTAGAVFSKDRAYRYRLWRTLRLGPKRVLFIMLNPSKAGAHESDMTVMKCVGFAERYGFDFVDVVNLYAFIATDPKQLWQAKEPIGPRNDEAIRYSLNRCAFTPGTVVCAAWGNSIADEEDPRVRAVLRFARAAGIKEIQCLGETAHGCPRHPSRIGYDHRFQTWRKL